MFDHHPLRSLQLCLINDFYTSLSLCIPVSMAWVKEDAASWVLQVSCVVSSVCFLRTLGNPRGTLQNHKTRTLFLFLCFSSLLKPQSCLQQLSNSPHAPLHQRGTISGTELSSKRIYETVVALWFSLIYFHDHHQFISNDTGFLFEEVIKSIL